MYYSYRNGFTLHVRMEVNAFILNVNMCIVSKTIVSTFLLNFYFSDFHTRDVALNIIKKISNGCYYTKVLML